MASKNTDSVNLDSKQKSTSRRRSSNTKSKNSSKSRFDEDADNEDEDDVVPKAPLTKIHGSLRQTFQPGLLSKASKASKLTSTQGKSFINNPFSEDEDDNETSNSRIQNVSSPRITKTYSSSRSKRLSSTPNTKTVVKRSREPSLLERPHFPLMQQDDNGVIPPRSSTRKLRTIPRLNFNEDIAMTPSDLDDDVVEYSYSEQRHMKTENPTPTKIDIKTKPLNSTGSNGKLDKLREVEKAVSSRAKLTSVKKQTRSKTDSISTKLAKLNNKTKTKRKVLEPIPLTKLSARGAQKPLEVDIETLEKTSKGNSSGLTSRSQVEITGLDVLHHLVKEFKVPVSDEKDHHSVDPEVENDNLRLYILYHLSSLLDYQSSIKNLLNEVHGIEKEKTMLREQLFELRQEHRNLGNEMNQVRKEFRERKDGFEHLKGLESTISDINVRGEEVKDSGGVDLNVKVEKGLESLAKVVNPHHGIYQKLLLVNNKLEDQIGKE